MSGGENSGLNFAQNSYYKKFYESKATAITFAKDLHSTKNLTAVLASDYLEKKDVVNFYLIETFFTEKGIERKTISDFGLIGMILEKLK
jgi:hypothetical protein